MIVKYIFFSPINYMSTLNFQSGVYFGLNRENGNIYRLIEKAPEFLFEKNIYYGLDTSTGNIYRLIDRGVSFNFESNVYYSLDEISGNIYRIKKNAEYIGLIEDYPGISKTRTSIEEELISHGETSTIIDVIKEGMTSLIRDTRGTKTRMILHENSKNNLRDVILRGSNKLNKRVRRRASLKMLFEQNIYVKEFKFNKVDLDLPEKFKKERAIVFRNDETVKIKDLASDEGFYSVLDNNENIHFELGDKLLTYTRNDDGDTERYNLTIGLEGHDDISIEDSPENYNIVSNNNLYVDDEIKINVGGNVRIFLIGSIGDGGIGTVDGSIYLSAGNRVYIDNTQSNTAANTALKIDGGTLIKKDTWFGKDLNIVDNGTILGDTSNLEVEELVGDSPLLIIGENNTGDNLLSGYINRYKNNSNDYKFAGLIRNTINSKPYLLINNISVDNTNKDIDRNDFDLISTNTNNNYKDYYSNLYFNKLKSLSIEGQNNNVSSITTKGSLGISKNVYLGDSNHSNVLINIGNDTQISYNKSNDSKFKFNTNVDIDISSLGNKSISFNSSNDFKYNIINNNDLLISNLYNENINGSSSVMIENDCNEFYAKDLTILAESYGRTYKGSYVIESPVPLMTTYNKDFTKTINNIQDYTNTLESNEREKSAKVERNEATQRRKELDREVKLMEKNKKRINDKFTTLTANLEKAKKDLATAREKAAVTLSELDLERETIIELQQEAETHRAKEGEIIGLTDSLKELQDQVTEQNTSNSSIQNELKDETDRKKKTQKDLSTLENASKQVSKVMESLKKQFDEAKSELNISMDERNQAERLLETEKTEHEKLKEDLEFLQNTTIF